MVGSQLIMKLIERFPWLVIAGGGLLGYIAGEIATDDAAVKPWIDARLPQLHWIAPAAGVGDRRRRGDLAHAASEQDDGCDVDVREPALAASPLASAARVPVKLAG